MPSPARPRPPRASRFRQRVPKSEPESIAAVESGRDGGGRDGDGGCRGRRAGNAGARRERRADGAGGGYREAGAGRRTRQHEDEAAGRSRRGRLTLLLALLAGAGLGIWGAPKLAPLLPRGWRRWPGGSPAGQRDRRRRSPAAGAGRRRARRRGGAARGPRRARTTSTRGSAAAVDAAEAPVGGEIAAVKESVGQLGGGTTAADRPARIVARGPDAELAALKQQLSGTAAAPAASSPRRRSQKIDVYRAELDGLRAEVGEAAGQGRRARPAGSTRWRPAPTGRSRRRRPRSTRSRPRRTPRCSAAATQSDLALIRAAIASGQPFAAPLSASARPGVTVPPGLDGRGGERGRDDGRAARPASPTRRTRRSGPASSPSAGEGVLARSRAFLEAQMASRSLTPQAGARHRTRCCRGWRTGCGRTT